MTYQALLGKVCESDRRSQKLRKQNEYWRRVWYFYKNNDWGGWDEIEQQILKKITTSSASAYSRLREKLNRLGLRLCAEWAKHNDARKIDYITLQRLLGKLKHAPVLEKAISEIEEELSQREGHDNG